LEKLHKIFFQSAFSGEISLSAISAELGLTTYEAVNIVKDLIHNSIIEWQHFNCDGCGKEISEPILYCDNCKHNLTDWWVFHVNGDISDQDQETYRKFSAGRYDAERFAARLKEQGCMYYLLLDLVESENIQEQDDLQYNKFLERIRILIEQKAMSQAKDPILCFGEVGDCLKLAFISPNDPKTVLEAFSQIIRTEPWGRDFPLLKAEEAKYFPRYDGIIRKIPISPRRKEDMKNIFCITLNGAIDFNDYELTKLFRFDNAIKTRKEIFNGNTVLSVWVQDQTLKDMEWDETPITEAIATSHNKEKKEFFGLVAYTGFDNNPIAIENPKDFKKQL
jgi:hypothetical protein